MAKVYMITEEEMNSLFDQLKLEAFSQATINGQRIPIVANSDLGKMHGQFHFVTVRWAQKMGFSTVR